MSDYTNFMEEKVKPWLETTVHHDYVESFDGLKLSYYQALNPKEKATIVIVHGFCEFFGKYHELAYRFYEQGYSIYFLELRGHGKSGRVKEFEDSRVHVQDFDEYVKDVETLVNNVVIPNKKAERMFLFAHSMGGAVSALLLEKEPDMFQCAVLSSPMLQMNYGHVPEWTVGALAVYSEATKKSEEYAPSQHDWEGEYDHECSSCMSKERYDYQFNQRIEDPSYQTWGGTWGWAKAAGVASDKAVKNAYKVTIPVLLLQAGKDSMVKPSGQIRFVMRSKKTTMLKFEDAKHELFNMEGEALEEYYRDIFAFYKAHLPHLKKS